MALFNDLSVSTITLEGVNNGTVTVGIRKDDGTILLAWGTTIPTPATTGYAKGCMFIDTDVATKISGSSINVGTSTSCLFRAFGPTVTEYDTAGDILRTSGTTVPADTTTGYAKGCMFIDTDVATKTSGTYINVGTNTSCIFRAVGPTVTEYDTAGMILRSSGTTVPGAVAGHAKGAQFIDTDVASPTSGLYQNVGDTTTANYQLVGGYVQVPVSIYIGTLGAGLSDTLVHSFTMPAYASALIKAECWCSAVTDVVRIDVKEATTTLLTTAAGIALTANTKTTDTVVAAGDPVASGAVINIHATSTGSTGAATNVRLTLIFKLATY